VECSIARGSFKDGRIGAPGPPALRAVPGVDDFLGITVGAWQMRPLSRGYVKARSPNLAEAPAINPGYLSDPTDRRAIVGGLRFVRRLFAAPALACDCGAESLPGAAVAATTNCSTMRDRRARRSITRPAPARWAAAGWRRSTTSCAAARPLNLGTVIPPVVYPGPPPSDGLRRSVLFAFLVDPTAIPRPPT
jgi:hypothetical protein